MVHFVAYFHLQTLTLTSDRCTCRVDVVVEWDGSDNKMFSLFCWWHVLCAMQMHFHTEEFPELWERVWELVKTSDQSRFDSLWEWIQTNPSVPQSFVDYLKVNWMSVVSLWSGISQKNQMIFQEGDTNMLIES